LLLFLLDTLFRTADKNWQDGFVHVIIRQLPSTPDIPPNKVKLELVVADTGKVRTDCHLNGAIIDKRTIGNQPGFSQGESSIENREN
jgi:hypothetical protein